MAFFDTTWYINFGNGSSTGYYAVAVWPGALTAVTAGTWCRQSATPTVGNERCFVCVTAGTTGAAEPVWVVTRGADSAANIDGTVKWMECTGMAGPCGDLTNAPVWVLSRVVSLGEVYYDSVSGSLQAATTAGTSGSGSAPSFSATAGVTTSDNTVTWTSLGATSNYTSTKWKYPHARLANAIASTWGAAGNTFYVSNNHAETRSTAGGTFAFPGTNASPNNVLCVTDTAAPPTTLNTTATIKTTTTTAITLDTGYVYIYGIGFTAGSGANTVSLPVAQATGGLPTAMILESCTLNLGATTGGNITFGQLSPGNRACYCQLVNTNLTFSAAAQQIILQCSKNIMSGGSIAASGTVPTTLFQCNGGSPTSGTFLFRDVDISAVTGTLFSIGTGGGIPYSAIFENCKLGAAVALSTGSAVLGGVSVKFHNCDSTNTNYRYADIYSLGTALQETTVVRTGGNTNGTTSISWNITSSSTSTFYFPYISDEVQAWNDISGAAITATIFLTSNTSLDNSKFWVEWEYAGTSSFPLGVSTTTRMTPLGTPTALTSDTSTWGGSISNKYSIASTFTPQGVGPVKARFYLATPSITVYVDPRIQIKDANGNIKSSGRQFLIPGYGMTEETAPGFMSNNINTGSGR